MQPALADVVQNLIFTASAATAIAFRAAMMSFPWCGPPARASPKSSVYTASPTTGKTSFGVAARSARAVATRTTARPARSRRGVARAVVRCLTMERRRSGAPLEVPDPTRPACRVAARGGAVRVPPGHEDRRVREAGSGAGQADRPADEAARPLARG